MLRLRLKRTDLASIRIVHGVAPMVELSGVVAPERRGSLWSPSAVAAAGASAPGMALLADLMTARCSPGFMFPTMRDGEEAVEAVIATSPAVMRRDLEGQLTAGQTIPPWTADLVRTGPNGLAMRRQVGEALRYLLDNALAPVLRQTRPLVNAAVRGFDERLRTAGPEALLDSLHPHIRYRAPMLEVDLASGADVAAESAGAGLVIVPSLGCDGPTVTVRSEESAPAMLAVPVGANFPGPTGENRPGTNLQALIGLGRTTVLEAIAARPGSSTTRVAAFSGMAPASVSEHARVLRDNGLVVTLRQGSAVAHFVTALGRVLLDG